LGKNHTSIKRSKTRKAQNTGMVGSLTQGKTTNNKPPSYSTWRFCGFSHI